MYFYTQAKNSEHRVQLALEGIKTQTEALQALNSRTVDRLTKFVTTPREEPNQTALLFANTIRDMPDILLRLIPPNNNGQDSRNEILHLYLALYYYTGETNLWASFSLPPLEAFDETQNFDRLVKTIVDRSAGDFQFMSRIVDALRSSDIQSCSPSYIGLYNEAHANLRPFVGDTTHHFARIAQQQKATG